MDTRLKDRIAAVVSMLLLTALGLFTFYLSEVADRDRSRQETRPAAATGPDYFVERLAVLGMTALGEPSFRLEAQQLQHFPADDTSEFEEPVMVSLDPDRPRITVTADRGRLTSGGTEAHMSGNVIVTRAAAAGAAPMRADTDYAIVIPDRDIVRTDWPVTIVQGANRLTGVGMELDNRTRQLKVDSQVRAVWQAPSPAAAPAARPARGQAAN
jgi:lipopolysaccharide export system protein LptC